MAKESMKAREVKRAKLVAKYAAKKAQLKAEGNYEALQLILNLFKALEFLCRTVDACLRISNIKLNDFRSVNIACILHLH